MGALTVKDGVDLRPDAAGIRLLGALDRVARPWLDLEITCGREDHPPQDPHTLGHAFDVHTHGLLDEEKKRLVRELLIDLQEGESDAPVELTIRGVWYALAVHRWFAQIEDHHAPSEHAHCQLRRGMSWPPTPFRAASMTPE